MTDYDGLTQDQLIAILHVKDKQVANLHIIEEQLLKKVERYRAALESIAYYYYPEYSVKDQMNGMYTIAKQALEEKDYAKLFPSRRRG